MKKTVYLVVPEKIGVIAPEIYGHFTEHIGGVFRDGVWVGKGSEIPNIRGFRKEIVEKLRRISPSVIRWPGGCFAETYHWRDGIGADRPVRVGWWTSYDGRMEPNEVGTHEFMDFCGMVGAKPYFAVNLTSVPPMEAREWVEYCTAPRGSTTLALEREKNGSPEPFDIPFWGIGNENWGDGGHMSPEFYALEYRRFSSVVGNLLRRRDGTRLGDLICCGANGPDYAWTQGVTAGLAGSKAPVDGMSIHYYCGNSDGKAGQATDFTVENWYDLVNRAEAMEEVILRHFAVLQGYGMEKQMKLVVDEWGCWHPEGSGPSAGGNLFEQQSTMRDAVIAALTLNIFNNHCDKVRMANLAQLCNNLHSLFLTQGEKCVTTPNYGVFELFRSHQGAEAIRTVTQDNADPAARLSVSASVKDGDVTLTLANCSCEQSVTVEPVLLGAGWAGDGKAYLLSGEDMHAHNTFERPDAVAIREIPLDGRHRLTLPPASVAMLHGQIRIGQTPDGASVRKVPGKHD